MELLPGAVEPAYFTVTADAALADPPGVSFDGAVTWHQSAWETGTTATATRRAVLLVAHPTATAPAAGAVVVPLGTSRAHLRVVDGDRVFIRPASDTLVVKP